MIITKLKGGLGNQIFQYACGRALALRNNDRVKLDIIGYNSSNGIDTVRKYSLFPFNIKAEIATEQEILKLKYPFGIISKGMRFFRAKILRQFETGLNKKILNYKGSIYLDGFFQTEKYFLDKEKEIRDDLKLTASTSAKFQENFNLIKNTPISVSLHVRRGDYVSDKVTNLHHGTCNAEYYAKALEYITSKIGNEIKVFVFSDDINWVKENMPLAYPAEYVSAPEIPDYEELILMSKCNHNIIANSSFSWWGAWLNENRDKIVVAPSKWVQKNPENFKDVVPNTWYRI